MEKQILEPRTLLELLQPIIDSRRKPFKKLERKIKALKATADDADLRLSRLYEAIEAARVSIEDASVVERIDMLRQKRDEHHREAEETGKLQDRVAEMVLDPARLKRAASKSRLRMRNEHPALKKFMQIIVNRVDVATDEIRLRGVSVRLMEGILHIGEGASLPVSEWRKTVTHKDEDCFAYIIQRETAK